ERRAILDKVQHVPELFAALEPAIDANRNSRRFILTGSSNALLIPHLSDSLAGRMEILRLYPLCQVELERTPATFLTSYSATSRHPSPAEFWARSWRNALREAGIQSSKTARRSDETTGTP